MASTLAAGLAAIFHVRGYGFDHYAHARRLIAVAAGLWWGCAAILAAGFLFHRYTIEYVHEHTRTGTPLPYRFAGLWGGHEGTLLLWTAIAATALAWNARRWDRRVQTGRSPPPDPLHPLPWTMIFGCAAVLGLGLVALAAGPFDRTLPAALDAHPDGRGLQPVLLTPYMVIHPPLQFLAYGLVVLPFAAALAHLVTRRPEWADVALPWTRAAVVTSWTGLGLGALWAYYVLNFGGYWAWDPVETANLLTFLPLLPLVHGLIYYRSRGMMAVLAPTAAILAFLATLFATLSTRTGLWVSVHSFTDPTRNFEPDPLQRLLDILDAEPLLRHLMRLFLLTLFATLTVILWRRLAQSRTRTSPIPVAANGAGLFLSASLGVLSLADPRLGLGALFEAAARIVPTGPPLGLALLILAVLVLLAWPLLLANDEDPKPQGPALERWIVMANLVYVGMLLLSLALLVIFLIDVMTVNGYHREAYDERLPFLAAPLLLVLGVALGNQALGRRRTLLLALGALLLGVGLAAAVPARWEILFGAPIAAFALLGAFVKLFKVSDRGPEAGTRVRLIGATLLVGGVAALTYWANPPTRIPLPLAPLHPPAWAAPIGYALGLLAVFGAVSTLRGRNYFLAQLGAVSLAASLAWVVALPLGVLAALALRRHRSGFAEGRESTEVRSSMTGMRRDLRKTGVYLIHVALVLGLAGYGTSTYLAGSETTIELDEGTVAHAHGYDFRLVGSGTTGADPQYQVAREIHADVLISRGTNVIATAPLTMWLELPLHYAERVSVQRLALEDLYLRPVRMNATGFNGEVSFQAHDDGVAVYPGAEVTRVIFTARTLPGMHLVWGATWMLSTGMLVALAFGGWDLEPKRAPRRE